MNLSLLDLFFYTLAIQTKKYNTMRKLMLAVIALLGFTLTASAQNGTKKVTTTKTETKVVLKKDGTPDKRYKKTETKVVLKKDGTPDKRFKENKKKK